jgi:predicted nucleic acid-binding protein
MIVVDTNVVSELMKQSPSGVVRDWLLGQVPAELFTTSITVAEILHGIARLPEGQRKDMLRTAAMDVFTTFEDHVLAFDRDAATTYALLVHSRDQRGLPIDGFDAQIAAICSTHHATLATRNVKDFEHTGIALVDPWKST